MFLLKVAMAIINNDLDAFFGSGKFSLQWLRVTRGTKRHQNFSLSALFFVFSALTPTDTRSVRLYILMETQNQLLLISNYTPQ